MTQTDRDKLLDPLGWKLLTELQTDARVSFAELGRRVGLTAGKVLGKAHERNRIKRRMREALRRHADLLPLGCDLILHPRRSILTVDFKKLEAEIVRILQQARTEAARMAPAPQQTTLAPPQQVA